MAQLLYPPSVNALQKQLNADYTASDAVITLTNTTSVQNKPGVVVINRIDVNSSLQPAANWTYIEYTGTSGATLTGCTAIAGDQDHALGEVVEFVSDVTQQQRILDALGNLVVIGTGALDTTKVVTPSGTQTLTNKTLTAPVLGGTATGTYTLGGTPTISSPTITTPTLTLADATTLTTDGGIKYDRTNEKLLIGDGSNTQAVQTGAWTTFTPTMTNVTLGNGTLTGRYALSGKSCFVNITFTMGSTSSVSGVIKFNLPVQAANTNRQTLSVSALDSGTNYRMGVCVIDANATLTTHINGDNTAEWNTTVPITWANGDLISISGAYETV